MEPDKKTFGKNIRHCLLFCFHQKKSHWCTQNYLWDPWWKCYSH